MHFLHPNKEETFLSTTNHIASANKQYDERQFPNAEMKK